MVTTRGERQVTWSQGQILPPEAALAFQLIAVEEAETHLPVVITHDCDLAAAVEKEPHAEILVAHPTSKPGAAANAKIARRLELFLHRRSGPQVVELLASQKRTVQKAALFEYAPRRDVWLAPQDRLILQRWLAARYRRAAFPEAFESRLRTKVDRRTLVEHIEAIMDEGGEWIRCLLFELDDGDISEREGPEDVYRLGITVLYASARDEPKAHAAAAIAAEALEQIFARAFERPGGAREYIDLLYCDAVSDAVLTVQQREQLTEASRVPEPRRGSAASHGDGIIPASRVDHPGGLPPATTMGSPSACT